MGLYLKIKKLAVLFMLAVGAIFLHIFVFLIWPRFFLKKKSVGKVYFKNNIELDVEIAASPYAWAKGLMFRQDLGKNKGMLFVFPYEAKRSFWMNNVFISLDLIFIDKNKKIVDIKENFALCKKIICEAYHSKELAMYVIETNAGYVRKNEIKIGEKVEIK